jgi:3-dehydroquinate synthase
MKKRARSVAERESVSAHRGANLFVGRLARFSPHRDSAIACRKSSVTFSGTEVCRCERGPVGFAGGQPLQYLQPVSTARSHPSDLCITVDASAETGGAYPVWIGAGLIARLPERLHELGEVHRWAIITDETVGALYGRQIASELAQRGFAVELFEFAPGEAQKTRETWAQLTDAMAARGIGRDSAVIAIGGGVTGDLAGFVAATYMRGLPCVQVPTTLLAMIDSSVGGKTGVDIPAGKNLVGVFRQPQLVLADPQLLLSLPETVYRAGLSEAVKHGMIADADYLSAIEREMAALLQRDAASLLELIRGSIEIKAAIVAADTTEAGARAALNFGHTIAHAIETVSGLAIPHGYAVSMGMVAEARIGEGLGVTEAGTAERMRDILQKLALPTTLPDGLPPSAVALATRADKKARTSRVRYTLIERAGKVARGMDGSWTFEAAPDLVQRVLEESHGHSTLSLDFTDV